MPDVGKLISGFRVFKATVFEQQKEILHHLVIQGQKPTTLVIACADLRIAPADFFATNPGELYVVTNIGGLVPKFNTDGVHGILAAIEYAVVELEVENILVFGHAKCESIKMMMSDKFISETEGLSQSMKTWLSIASEARDAVKNELADEPVDYQQAACEHESIVISLRNLLEYPYISERLERGSLQIFGWHFDVETGDIMAFDPDTGFFEPLS
jgi:carbonic anhydrase